MHTEEVITRDQELLTGSTSEIALALERREMSFPMLMKLLYLRAQGEDQQKRWSALYHRALTLFMEIYGGISESFYANEFVAGALLTRKDELFFNIWWDQFKFDTIPARSLEADINDLRLKTGLYLTEDHRRICTARLFRLYKTLISSLRLEYYRWTNVNQAEGGPAISARLVADLNQIRKELEMVRDTYMRIGLARGRVQYVTAAAAGTAAIIAMGGIAALLLGKGSAWIWIGAIAGGAVGSLLSVLERLTRGALRVQFQTGSAVRFMSGISRPIVGALSGLALFVLIKGDILLPFVKSSTEADQGLFFAGLAFIAGFSERFLKDVLGNAGNVIRPAEAPSAEEGETGHSRVTKESTA
jgi:hypothetical protein